MQRIYLDYAASTPVDPEVLDAMLPYFGNSPARHESSGDSGRPARHARQRAGVAGWGNPGSLHSFGQESIAAVDKSRETIAKSIGADFREVIFTGSASEANNLALRGLTQTVRRQTQTDKDFSVNQREVGESPRPRIVVSAVEHESILETARDLERDGVEVVYIPVDRHGVVDLEKLKVALNERTILVSIMYANNEIGTVQPIAEISKIVRNFREQIANSKSQKTGHSPFAPGHLPLFHTDAAQAFQFLDCNVDGLGVDLMTLSAHKIYGPKGVGALYVRQQIANRKLQIAKNHLPFASSHLPLAPLTTGGGQEFGLRSGTENVPLIVGFAKAVELLFSNSHELENSRIAKLRDYFWTELKKIYPEAQTNVDYTQTGAEVGPRTSASSPRQSATLPSVLNVYFPDHLAEDLLTKFDLAGLAVSSGSACRSRAVESSYVIEALGYSGDGSTKLTTGDRAKRSVRFSFGRPTTNEEVNAALTILKGVLQNN
ncbi:MAG: hypothetical protein A2945_01735 [Candidatus Liptonbacteria bacterium RIFCSPLOWO2_01_FULL_52_25]|uniref:cysteine desulfurase n=1 Tax=Candidatus Liptonbacteria bacterium RIFCSPLOWO2_01_FULL_52_25 TaxID=1798650 RepID=A0A1G2CER6_9BACT|nr:MAG: hypothetical protein A2945_01735 [Candidatus Liptonbacteria bacterium RIFCSPLOWO2_01_FULL_52_25]